MAAAKIAVVIHACAGATPVPLNLRFVVWCGALCALGSPGPEGTGAVAAAKIAVVIHACAGATPVPLNLRFVVWCGALCALGWIM